MEYPFNADEIFEIAEQIERNGTQFYRDAAEKVSDESARALLLKLADMEVDHERTFARMRLEMAPKVQTVVDPQGEPALYLRSLADTRVFFQKQIDLSRMEAILKAAIQAEKDSIVFYLGMREIVPPDMGQDQVDAIIKEEMRHLTMLAEELKKLK